MIELVVQQFVQEHCQNIVRKGDNLFCDCPFCGKSKQHFNISTLTGEFHCYRCGRGGDFSRFVKFFKGKKASVSKITEEYTSNISLATLASIYQQEESVKELLFEWKSNTLPLIHKKLKCQRAQEYLLSRNIPLDFAIEHDIRVGIDGKYDNMLIIPVFFNQQVVNFVARRFHGVGRRYDGPHNDEAIMNKSHILYNFDATKNLESVVLVEGVFDAFALMLKEVPVVALMGKEISSEQVKLTMCWSRVIVLLDGGFLKDGLKVAHSMEGLVDDVQVAVMPEGIDPSDSPETALKAISESGCISCF